MKKFILLSIAILQLIFPTACTKTTVDNSKLQVYTSFYAMYDFARIIGGDMADVHILCPPGQEPHDFEPTAQDIAKLSNADVFIYNGMGMEHWTESVKETLPNDVTIIQASDYTVYKTVNDDPHVWLNPDNAYSQMSAIATTFAKKDPDNAQYYDAKLNDARKNIDTLNNRIKKINNVSSIVVSHEAYTHLCDAIGVSQLSVNGKDNTTEPTPKKLLDIENYIKNNNIKYVFTEPLGTSDIMKTIANDTGCEVLTLDPLEGNPDNKDYFTVMNENLDALEKALN